MSEATFHWNREAAMRDEMTDRELLEKAAGAAGMALTDFAERGVLSPEHWGYVRWMKGAQVVFWNPLTDDGDALRLAVKLRIELFIEQNGNVTARQWFDGKIAAEADECSEDILAATRRAIVRAAASLSPKSCEGGGK